MFDERAARVAAAFTAAGLKPDSKVASYLYNCNEYTEALYGTFKMRGVPVNVNYRYLEDELVYLLDNSDAEALLFHGSLGDQVAKIRDRAPQVKLWIQVDDGSPRQEFAAQYEDLLAAHEPMERIERSGDDLYFLYTGGTTGMPKGVMWRAEDLFGVLGDSVYPLVGTTRPDTMAEVGPIAKSLVDAGANRVHLPASPLMHGTGAFTTFQALFVGAAIVTLVGRNFDPHELWETVQRERVTQMAIVGDAFAKPMLRALEEAEAKGKPYDLSSLQLIISSGVMWSAEVKHGLMQRGGFICLDSLGSSEGVGFAGSISTPGSEQKTAKFTIGASTKVFNDQGVEVVPGSGEVGRLAVGGNIPLGYYKDAAKSDSTFLTIGGSRWSVPGDFASVEADGTITLLGPRLGGHQLGGREDLPRGGRGGGEGASGGGGLPRGGPAGRALRRSGDGGGVAASRRTCEHRRPDGCAGAVGPLQATAPIRFRRRSGARTERQGRLQVGPGRGDIGARGVGPGRLAGRPPTRNLAASRTATNFSV